MTTEIALLAPHELVKTPEVISLRREARAIRDSIEMVCLMIQSIEAKTKRRGGPTSQMGKTLFKLKGHCTALHMALASVRNRLREIFSEAKPPVLHCELLTTPDGLALITTDLQDVIAELIHAWIKDGQEPDMFGIVNNVHRRIIREAAIHQMLAADQACLALQSNTSSEGASE